MYTLAYTYMYMYVYMHVFRHIYVNCFRLFVYTYMLYIYIYIQVDIHIGLYADIPDLSSWDGHLTVAYLARLRLSRDTELV